MSLTEDAHGVVSGTWRDAVDVKGSRASTIRATNTVLSLSSHISVILVALMGGLSVLRGYICM